MRDETILDVRCPLRFSKYIGTDEERCRKDCAWLLSDDNGNSVCSIALLAGAETNWSVRARFGD